MYNHELSLIHEDVIQEEIDESLIQIFNEMLTDIYYDGYAGELIKEDPKYYAREFYYFLQKGKFHYYANLKLP